MKQNHPPSQANSPAQLPRSLFWLFLFLYSLTGPGTIQTSDGRVMFLLTQSLVEERSISFYMPIKLTSHSEADAEGRQYSQYGLGNSLLAVPLYLAGKTVAAVLPVDPAFTTQFFSSFLNALITALTAVFIFRFARDRLAYSVKTSYALSLAYGLSTMAWYYSGDFLSEPGATLGILAGAYYLADTAPETRPRSLILSGVFLGIAILTRSASALAIPGFLLYLFLQWRSGAADLASLTRRAACFAIPLALFFGLIFLYNYVRYGNIFTTGYDLMFGDSMLMGLFGLLLSPGKSVFLYNPVLILGLAGLAKMTGDEKRRLLLLFAVLILGPLLLYSKWGSWYGGMSWGPRFLLVCVPYLLLPAGELLENRPAAWKWMACLLVAGCLIQLPALTVNIKRYDAHMRILHDDETATRLMNFSPLHSPVLGQVGEAATALRNLGDGEKLARMTALAKEKHSFIGSSYKDILENGLALNVPNFWWVYAVLFGIPAAWVALCAASLLGATVFFFRRSWKEGLAGEKHP